MVFDRTRSMFDVLWSHVCCVSTSTGANYRHLWASLASIFIRIIGQSVYLSCSNYQVFFTLSSMSSNMKITREGEKLVGVFTGFNLQFFFSKREISGKTLMKTSTPPHVKRENNFRKLDFSAKTGNALDAIMEIVREHRCYFLISVALKAPLNNTNTCVVGTPLTTTFKSF